MTALQLQDKGDLRACRNPVTGEILIAIEVGADQMVDPGAYRILHGGPTVKILRISLKTASALGFTFETGPQKEQSYKFLMRQLISKLLEDIRNLIEKMSQPRERPF